MTSTCSSIRMRVAAAIVLVALGLLAVPAAGQDGDPYGSTSTTDSPNAEATISITADSGPRGTEVGVAACAYTDDAPEGAISFDGEVVADGLVVNADGCLTTEGSQTQGDAPLTVRVPDDARPGNRNLCSVVAGYNTPCARFQVRNDDASVLGESIERDAGSSSGGSEVSLPLVGSLPVTGLGIGALLVAAALLLLVGRGLVAASDPRRQHSG